MIRRALALVVLIYTFGFLWFAVTLPQPLADARTDAVIVPTGAAGRIERGLSLIRAGEAQRVLITGVDPEVRPAEFAEQFDVPMALMECCVDLGMEAVDTRSNASETAAWLIDRDYRSIRLVTSDWHMRRASAELRKAIPPYVTVMEDGVPTEPSLFTLFLEYNKFLASFLSRGWFA